MIEKIKDQALAIFTISLLSTYFACTGYYSSFNIDITSFLSLEDLTLIFAKWTWVTIIYISIAMLFFNQIIINSNDDSNSYWNKTIGNTMIKKRVFIIITIILVLIILCLFYENFADLLMLTIGIVLILIFILFISFVLFAISLAEIEGKKSITEFPLSSWTRIIISIFLLIAGIPYLCGDIAAKNHKQEYINVALEDSIQITTNRSITNIYIGKTSKYFFVYNQKTKNTTAYSMDKVKSFEIVHEADKISQH